MIRKYAEIFCWKNVSSFCSAKATHIFSAKNIRILYIEFAKTVNEMTLNELVKLTTLWTTGPRNYKLHYSEIRGHVLWPPYGITTNCSEDRFYTKWPLRSMNTYKNENTWGVEVFSARLASFVQLGLISDLYINFLKSRNGFKYDMMWCDVMWCDIIWWYSEQNNIQPKRQHRIKIHEEFRAI